MRKSGVLTRLIALILMAAMVLPAAPLSAVAEGVAQYGYLVIENKAIEDRTVKFRPSPNSTDYLANLQEGWVMEILGTSTYKGDLWYNAKNPENGVAGYVKGSFVQLMTNEEVAAWQLTGFPVYAKPTPTPAPTPTAGTGLGFVRTIESGVNLRVSPGGTVLTEKDEDKIPEGLVLAYYGERPQEMGYDWVQVIYNGMLGFIRSDCYVKTDVLGNPLGGESQNPESTNAPEERKGYIRFIADKVAVRKTPAGEVLNDKDRVPLGAVLAYNDETDLIGKNKWALVTYKSYTGYVRSDCYIYCDESGNPVEGTDPSAPGTPTLAPETVEGYVKLISDGVFIRKTPAGEVLNYYDKLPLDLMLGYTERTQEPVKGYYWVKVAYKGYIGYIRSDCYTHCDEAGNPIASPAPAPAVTPTPTPAPGTPTGIPKPTGTIVYGDDTFGRTNTDKVFFRKEMSTDKDAGYWALLPYNWLLQALGAEPDKNGTIWYHVRGGIPSNPNSTFTGYVHSDYFKLVSGGKPNDYVPETDSNYAVVIINGINVRSSIGGSAVTALLSNTVVNIITRPTGSSANDWFFIEYNGVFGYVEASALRVLTKDELGNFTLPSAPAPTVTPSPTPAYTGTGFIKIISRGVNIRKTPAGTSLTPKDDDKLPEGLVIRYFEGPTEKISGYYWVKVDYNGIIGYVRSDCYMECDMAGNPVVSTPAPTPTYDPSVSAVTYVKLIKGGVNLRMDPWGTSQAQLDKGTILPYLGTKMNGNETWYEVYSSEYNKYGFILSTMAVFCDANGNPATPPSSGTESTPAPGVTYTGYAATTDSSVWVRSLAQSGSATVGKVLKKGTVLPMFSAVVTPVGSSYSWYPVVLSDGTKGYIRGDFAFELAQWQLDYYKANGVCPTPTPGPATPKPGNSEYIITTGDKLWVRADASTKAGTLGQLRLGTVTKFYGKKTIDNKNGTQTIWYEIKHNEKTGYLHGDYVRILSNAEYDTYLNQHPEMAPPTPTPMPDPSTFSDLALTTVERVKIRGAASMKGAELNLVYDPGTKVTYLGEFKKDVKESDGSTYTWFKVKYNGFTGWMRHDCVRILTKDEKAMYELAGDPDAAPEATYSTLSKGSSGDAVTKLQNKLVEKGYLAATEVNGYYGTSTEQAVIAFQRSTKTLTVDGIAGENTQHALFGTVPVGTYNGSSTSTVLYPVEKIDWYTGGIRNIWQRNEVAVITDVRTGISFRAKHLYGDNHVDIEPVTSADTQAYCEIYGVNNPQEIDDHEQQLQSYRRRPLWVTIDGRTFAASLYGIPHGYPGTDRIPDNNFNGVACVHFTNSMTHGDSDSPAHVDYAAAINGWFGHQDAIEYAYKNSQSGNK